MVRQDAIPVACCTIFMPLSIRDPKLLYNITVGSSLSKCFNLISATLRIPFQSGLNNEGQIKINPHMQLQSQLILWFSSIIRDSCQFHLFTEPSGGYGSLLSCGYIKSKHQTQTRQYSKKAVSSFKSVTKKNPSQKSPCRLFLNCH